MIKLLLIVAFLLPLPAMAQHGINLTWTLSNTPGVTSQLVCRSTTSGGENCSTPLATINNGTSISYLDPLSDITPGTKYYYVMEACISTVCSVPSGEVSATYPSVNPPTNLVAVPQ